MNSIWNGLLKKEGHWVEYLVSFPTQEIIAFRMVDKLTQRAISSIYGRYCRSLVIIEGVDAKAIESHVELRCGKTSALLHKPSRNALDSILRRFKANNESYQFHVFRL